MNNACQLDPTLIFTSDNDPSIIKNIILNRKKDYNQNSNSPLLVEKLLNEYAEFIDSILIHCWNHFLKQHSSKISLIATGGYGRKELFPYSDIDILILLDSSETIEFQDCLSLFSNFLWDIGLKPGQSVRTIPECIHTAKEDQTILTNLLEVRLLCGNIQLFNNLNKQIIPQSLWPSDKYFAAKMQEQDQRYSKYHDTAYNLEPNIKEGPGGLRDLQNIGWVFKHHYSSSTTNDLIKYNFLTTIELDELISCRNILWSIRFALHLLTNRCEDRILFDHQRDLATLFNFTDTDNNPDVEQFMQHYFKTVMELERMNELLLQLFSERLSSKNKIEQLSPINQNFVSINNYIEAKDNNTFEKHPYALLEIFTILQLNSSLKGIRATTIRLIRKNLYLINNSFRTNKTINQLFLDIFKSHNGITNQLRKMNRYGILAAYLPDFSNIVARMQYDLFHIYTVDAHTLFVVRNLRRFSLDKYNNEVPFCNSVFLRIKQPEVLYITALFHDIAKGVGGDHSVLGEKIVTDFCHQHLMSNRHTKLISWLVRNHLLMSMTAQRKDISDPDIIHNFALQVGSIDYLNHIYLFTVADIRATNPSLWTSWKDSLLIELYTLTHSALRRGLQDPITKSDRILDNKYEANEELTVLGISEKTINKTWEIFNSEYFLRFSADEISWHTIAIASTPSDQLPLVLLRPQNIRDSVEIFIHCHNEKYIFSLCADTFDQLDLTILDARVVTITSPTGQNIFNSFQVLEQSGKPIIDLSRELYICNTLKTNLQNRSVKPQSNLHRQSRQAKHFPIKSKIYFHKDPQDKYTIIEIITTDHPGLLSSISQVFNELNILLHDAKITTIGSRVEDMFYVSNLNQKPIDDVDQLNLIRSRLMDTLNINIHD